MFHAQFEAAGPVMHAVLAAWIVVLAGVLDRLLYLGARTWRRPLRATARLTARGERDAAERWVQDERRRAEYGLARIDAVSQIATSVGLFGTVLGIAQAFFARSGAGLSAPQLLSAGLATALYTTIAGLIVFLSGQVFLIAYGEWLATADQRAERLLEAGARR